MSSNNTIFSIVVIVWAVVELIFIVGSFVGGQKIRSRPMVFLWVIIGFLWVWIIKSSAWVFFCWLPLLGISIVIFGQAEQVLFNRDD
jgi:hypothetical protein